MAADVAAVAVAQRNRGHTSSVVCDGEWRVQSPVHSAAKHLLNAARSEVPRPSHRPATGWVGSRQRPPRPRRKASIRAGRGADGSLTQARARQGSAWRPCPKRRPPRPLPPPRRQGRAAPSGPRRGSPPAVLPALISALMKQDPRGGRRGPSRRAAAWRASPAAWGRSRCSVRQAAQRQARGAPQGAPSGPTGTGQPPPSPDTLVAGRQPVDFDRRLRMQRYLSSTVRPTHGFG